MKTLLLIGLALYLVSCSVSKPVPVQKTLIECVEEAIVREDRLENLDD